MAIAKADTVIRDRQLRDLAPVLEGRMLDLGSGGRARYFHYLEPDRWIRLDIDGGRKPHVVGDAGSIPFAGDSFDSVLSVQMLEHVPRPFAVVEEVFRVLRPGGRFVLQVPQFNELHEEPHDYFRYTNFGLEHMLRSAGFEVLEVIERGGFFSLIAHATARYMIDRFGLLPKSRRSLVLAPAFRVLVSLSLTLDRLDQSVANRKHALGWTVVSRKPSG